MNFCKYCGNELAPGAKFCNNCGQPVAGKETEPQDTTQDTSGDSINQQQSDTEGTNSNDLGKDDHEHESGTSGDDRHHPLDNPENEQSEWESDPNSGVEGTGPNASDSQQITGNYDSSNQVPLGGVKQNTDEMSTNQMQSEYTGGLGGSGIGGNKNAGTNHSKPLKQPKKKTSKKTKVIVSSVVALIIILFAGYMVGNSLLSPEKTVDKFRDAINDDDAKTVANMIESENTDLKINESSVQGFIDYYNNNSNEMDYLIDHLRSQVEEDGVSDSGYAINLKKDGKKFGIYDNYVVQVIPVYFEVYTNYADTEISMGDDVLTTSDSDDFTEEIGPFLPGKYTFVANYKTDLIDLSTEVESEQFDPGTSKNIELFIEGEEVEVYTPYEGVLDAVNLYVNGEDIGVNVLEDNVIGPVFVDGSMTASFEGEFPWGTLMTEELPIESNYIDVVFQADNDVKSDVEDTIVQFNKEYLDVYTSADPSKFTVAGDAVVEDVVDQAAYEKENDIFYQGKFMGVDFYEDSFTLDNYGDGWVISVDTVTAFLEDLTYDPEEEDKDDDDNFEETAEEFGYELQYDADEETWKVTYIGWAGYMEEDKMIEYKEDDPTVYTSDWAGDDKKDKDDKDKEDE